MKTTIDWTKPIETLDGHKVEFAKCNFPQPDSDGDYCLVRVDGVPFGECNWSGYTIIRQDGTEWEDGTEVLIRNVAPATRTAAEQLERMEAFVRKLHDSYVNKDAAIMLHPEIEQEVAAIVALLPEPVDPDRAYAESIAAAATDMVEAIMAGIAYGRADTL